MSESEFFYWLQGFFELTLCDGPALLSKERARRVRRHVALARASLRRGQQLGERVARIEVCVEALLEGGDAGELTDRIRKEVAAQFEHVIDQLRREIMNDHAQAGDAEQAKLNDIHGIARSRSWW